MNINFGLFPPYELSKEERKGLKGKERGKARKRAMAIRARQDILKWEEPTKKLAA